MKIEFREAKTKFELEQMFQLRYEVYALDDELKAMVKNRATDVSGYDLTSLHFGAFKDDVVIGYLRFCTEHLTHFSKWTQQIMDSLGVTEHSKRTIFPFQQFYPDQEWSRGFINQLEGSKFGEMGKLAIHPTFRQDKALLEKFISAFLSYCIDENGVEVGFGICTKVLQRFYRKFGFSVVEGAVPFVYKDLPEATILQFAPN